MFLIACGRSGDAPEIVFEPPGLPPLPREIAEPCPDPGVDSDALSALVSHREALAECRRRHRAVVGFYQSVGAEFGG